VVQFSSPTPEQDVTIQLAFGLLTEQAGLSDRLVGCRIRKSRDVGGLVFGYTNSLFISV